MTPLCSKLRYQSSRPPSATSHCGTVELSPTTWSAPATPKDKRTLARYDFWFFLKQLFDLTDNSALCCQLFLVTKINEWMDEFRYLCDDIAFIALEEHLIISRSICTHYSVLVLGHIDISVVDKQTVLVGHARLDVRKHSFVLTNVVTKFDISANFNLKKNHTIGVFSQQIQHYFLNIL